MPSILQSAALQAPENPTRTNHMLLSAGERKARLSSAVPSHGAPGRLNLGLAIVANRSRLPRLVKGLKVEDVGAPREGGADTLLEEGGSIARGRSGGAVGGAAIGRPAGLAGPELDGVY